jgi:hypothetical protein
MKLKCVMEKQSEHDVKVKKKEYLHRDDDKGFRFEHWVVAWMWPVRETVKAIPSSASGVSGFEVEVGVGVGDDVTSVSSVR